MPQFPSSPFLRGEQAPIPSGSLPGVYSLPQDITSQDASSGVRDWLSGLGGFLPSSPIPGAENARPPLIGSQDASRSLGGLLPQGNPLNQGNGGANGLVDGLQEWFTDPKNLLGLGTLLMGLLTGGGGGANAANAQRQSQITEERMRRVDPLHQAVTQLAWGRLPINARQGIAPPTYKPLP